MKNITLIPEELMIDAISLAKEGEMIMFVLNDSGIPDITKLLDWKFEEPRRRVIAYFKGNEGFGIEDDNYSFQTDPSSFF